MKIWSDGVLREMTQKEEADLEKANAEMMELLPIKEEKKELIEEFIERLAEANSVFDIISIAKDMIKERKNGS